MENLNISQFFLIFILPVLLGILTTVVVFMAKAYFNDTFMPWYKNKMEQSYTVKGRWKSVTNPTYSPNYTYEETIYIQQLSEKIWGNIFYKELFDSENEGQQITEKHFQFDGTFTDSVLSATYWNPDRQQKGRGTFCLYSHESDILKGKYSWYEPNTKEIESGEYVWERQTL